MQCFGTLTFYLAGEGFSLTGSYSGYVRPGMDGTVNCKLPGIWMGQCWNPTEQGSYTEQTHEDVMKLKHIGEEEVNYL